jgi:hypothetical protein
MEMQANINETSQVDGNNKWYMEEERRFVTNWKN